MAVFSFGAAKSQAGILTGNRIGDALWLRLTKQRQDPDATPCHDDINRRWGTPVHRQQRIGRWIPPQRADHRSTVSSAGEPPGGGSRCRIKIPPRGLNAKTAKDYRRREAGRFLCAFHLASAPLRCSSPSPCRTADTAADQLLLLCEVSEDCLRYAARARCV